MNFVIYNSVYLKNSKSLYCKEAIIFNGVINFFFQRKKGTRRLGRRKMFVIKTVTPSCLESLEAYLPLRLCNLLGVKPMATPALTIRWTSNKLDQKALVVNSYATSLSVRSLSITTNVILSNSKCKSQRFQKNPNKIKCINSTSEIQLKNKNPFS